MSHYLNYLFKIFKKPITTRSKWNLAICYLEIIFKANVENKIIFKKRFASKKLYLQGFFISFYSYPLLLNLFEEIFIDEIYHVTNSPPHDRIKIFDCGSNIGMSILYFKKKFPHSVIIGFEPDVHIFKLLKQNIIDNKIQDATIYNFALAREPCKGRHFYTCSNDIDSLNGSFVRSPFHNHSFLVDTVCLSSYLVEEVDILKLDIEGLEDEVITELSESKKIKLIHNLLLEYHRQCATPITMLIKKITEMGFKLVFEKTEYWNNQEQMLRFKKINDGQIQ